MKQRAYRVSYSFCPNAVDYSNVYYLEMSRPVARLVDSTFLFLLYFEQRHLKGSVTWTLLTIGSVVLL